MQDVDYAKECIAALSYVKSKLIAGAANKGGLGILWTRGLIPNAIYPVGAGVSSLRMHQGTRLREGPINEAWIRAIAVGAETAQCGNCGEQAAVAFAYLLNRGVFPLDYMYRTNGDHAFVLAGRHKESDPTKPETWEDVAVVCDPWYGTAFSGNVQELSKRSWEVASSYRQN